MRAGWWRWAAPSPRASPWPGPPSWSSTSPRFAIRRAACTVLYCTVLYCTVLFCTVLQVCEQDGCLSQQWVNYLGIYTTVASTLAAIAVARLADRVKGRLKEAIIALLGLAAVIFLFLSLISVGVFQFGSILYVQILVYILLILGTIISPH